jgi:hypothetical protein
MSSNCKVDVNSLLRNQKELLDIVKEQGRLINILKELVQEMDEVNSKHEKELKILSDVMSKCNSK